MVHIFSLWIISMSWIFLGTYYLFKVFMTKDVKSYRNNWGEIINVIIIFVVYFLLTGALHAYFPDVKALASNTYSDILASLSCLCGVFFATWARYCIGGNWSIAIVFKKDHELIKTGPYEYVRHPMYAGILWMLLGTVLVLGTLDALIALLIAFVSLYHKAMLEEELMEKMFKNSYLLYKSRTSSFIPNLF